MSSTQVATYYRVHPAGEAPETVLSESRWGSRVWCGEATLECETCCGTDSVQGADGYETRCPDCDCGYVEDVRRGVSACESIETLADYMGDRAANLDGCTVLVMCGELSDDEDHDASDGVVLVLPSEVVEVLSVEALGLAA